MIRMRDSTATGDREHSGFGLIELLTVVAIAGIGYIFALAAFGKGRREADVDAFASDVRNVILQARRRALNSGGRPVLVEVKAGSVSWCEIDDPLMRTTCPSPAGFESSSPIQAGHGVKVEGWRQDVDTGTAGPHLAIPGRLYFFPSGRVDSKVQTGNPATETPEGFTLYLQSTVDPSQKRKLTVYPLSGRPRITDKW